MSAGRFVWRELIVASPATAFYADLFGWSSKSVEMGGASYTLFHDPALGEDVGGAMAPQMEGVPPHWLAYITVENLEESLATVARLGGKVLTPILSAGGQGSFFIAQDPGGAVFGAFVGNNPGATSERQPPLGTFCWSQLMAANIDRSVSFYAGVFGWTPAPMGEMVVFGQGERQRASAMGYPPGVAMPDGWLNYVAVEDCDQSFEKAVALGATAHNAPTTIQGLGRFAVLADPSGAVFALWKNLGAGG